MVGFETAHYAHSPNFGVTHSAHYTHYSRPDSPFYGWSQIFNMRSIRVSALTEEDIVIFNNDRYKVVSLTVEHGLVVLAMRLLRALTKGGGSIKMLRIPPDQFIDIEEEEDRKEACERKLYGGY